MSMMTVHHVHVLHDPSPQTIEHILSAILHCEHHRVAHALGTYIIVTGVHHIAKSVFRLPIEFIGPLENLVPDLCHARINLKLAVSAFGEQRMLRTYHHDDSFSLLVAR